MSKYTTEFKVGLFTAVSVLVLVATALVLSGSSLAQKRRHFFTIIENASGIAKRSGVRISGVEVGSVTSIEILPQGVKIGFDIDADVPVPVGSLINLKSRGILGDSYLEIQRNISQHQILASGSEIRKNPDSNDMEALFNNLNSIARDIKKVTGNFAKVLGSEKGERSLQNIVDNVEKITSDLSDVTSSQKKNLKETIEAIRNSAVKIEGLITRNDAKIEGIISNLKQFSEELKEISSPENREKIEKIISNVDASAASLKRMLAKIEKGEGTIGQLIQKDDTADEVKQTLKSIQNVIKPIADLKLTISDRLEGRIANAQSGDKYVNQFDLKFATRPDRFYLLGISTAPYARLVEVTTTTTASNGPSTTVQTKQQNTSEDVGKFRFNAQISQRFSYVGLRLGLFASSGGAAADIYALDDTLVGTVEFSQFGGDPISTDTQYGNRGPFNLKAYANYFVTSNIFITGGIDGLVLYPSPMPFAGIGLSITDDDIKGLLGVASLGGSSATR